MPTVGMLVYLITNNIQFNKYYEKSYDMGTIIYKKHRLLKQPVMFMRIFDERITFSIRKSTINTIIQTLKQFSIRDFQYDIEILGNCSSSALNKLRPFRCELLSKSVPRNSVSIYTMFLYETKSQSQRIKPLVRDIASNRTYNYPHLLVLENAISLNEIDSSDYVIAICFDTTYSENDEKQCTELFPNLQFIDGDNADRECPFAFSEIMRLYQRCKT